MNVDMFLLNPLSPFFPLCLFLWPFGPSRLLPFESFFCFDNLYLLPICFCLFHFTLYTLPLPSNETFFYKKINLIIFFGEEGALLFLYNICCLFSTFSFVDMFFFLLQIYFLNLFFDRITFYLD